MYLLILGNSFIKIHFIFYTIHPFKIHTLMFYSIFTELCKPSPRSILEYFIIPKRSPIPISSHSPLPNSPPSALNNCYLLYVSIELPILDMSCKWHYIIYGLLRWHLSLSIMSSTFMHVVARVSSLVLFIAK